MTAKICDKCKKQCTICKQVKPLTEFHKQSSGYLGVLAHCKICKLADVKLYRKKTKGKRTKERMDKIGRNMRDMNEITIKENHAEILLYNKDGTVRKERGLIDLEDIDKIKQYKWHYSPICQGYVANKKFQLHRLLMNTPKGEVVFHVNGNGLDNRRNNLSKKGEGEKIWKNKNEIIIKENHAEIIFYNRDSTIREERCLIDIEDIDKIKQYKWGCCAFQDKFYVRHAIKGPLHRLIMDAPKGIGVSHVNGNGLDNRKVNLSLGVRTKYNQRSIQLRKNNTSGVTGVNWHVQKQKWTATMRFKCETIHLGIFFSKGDAIKARKAAEIKYYGAKGD